MDISRYQTLAAELFEGKVNLAIALLNTTAKEPEAQDADYAECEKLRRTSQLYRCRSLTTALADQLADEWALLSGSAPAATNSMVADPSAHATSRPQRRPDSSSIAACIRSSAIVILPPNFARASATRSTPSHSG